MAKMSNEKARGSPYKHLLLPLRIVVAALVVISEIARPLYHPFVTWVSSLSFVIHIGDRVASLPRLAILILFVVPFAIAEPLKIYALFVIAKGHWMLGVAIIVFAYLMSFLLVERIFHAGREKLLSYGWLRWIMDRVEAVRDWLAEIKKSVATMIRAWFRKAA